MIADEIRARLRTMPFKPFTVVKADGGHVKVHHHDYAWVLPTGGELYVQDTDGKVHWIYMAHITEVIHDENDEQPAARATGRP